jgi:large repetitive protein
VGVGPFVKTVTTSGKVGSEVQILGNKLTGATAVTFNGTAATFTVKSASLIVATVPTGATPAP